MISRLGEMISSRGEIAISHQRDIKCPGRDSTLSSRLSDLSSRHGENGRYVEAGRLAAF